MADLDEPAPDRPANLDDRLAARFADRGDAVALWGALLRAVSRVGRGGGDQLARWGLNPPQFDVLATIGRQPGLSQQELADRLLVTKGNVSQLLAKLERQELVRRERDGVANALYLSNRGAALLLEILPDHDAFLERRFGGLDGEEQEVLLRLLHKLDRSLS